MPSFLLPTCRFTRRTFFFLQKIDQQKNNCRDRHIYQYPSKCQRIIISSPQLIDGCWDRRRLSRCVTSYHTGCSILSQCPCKCQDRTCQDSLSAGRHANVPENISIRQSKSLTCLCQSLIKAFKGSSGSPVHQRKCDDRCCKDACIPGHHKLCIKDLKKQAPSNLRGPRIISRKYPTTVGGRTSGRVSTTSRIPFTAGGSFAI